jgi:hypothetical protein
VRWLTLDGPSRFPVKRAPARYSKLPAGPSRLARDSPSLITMKKELEAIDEGLAGERVTDEDVEAKPSPRFRANVALVVWGIVVPGLRWPGELLAGPD